MSNDRRMFYAKPDVIVASFEEDALGSVQIGKDVFDVVQLISVEVDASGSPAAKSIESIFIHKDFSEKDFSYSTILGDDGITHCAPKRFPSTFEFDHTAFFKLIEGSVGLDKMIASIKEARAKQPDSLTAIQLMPADKFLKKPMLKRAKKLGMFYAVLPINVLHIPLVKFDALPACLNAIQPTSQPVVFQLPSEKVEKEDNGDNVLFFAEAVVEDYVDNENNFDSLLEKRIKEVFDEYRKADSTECPEFLFHTFHIELSQFHNCTAAFDKASICGVFGSLHDPKSDQANALAPNDMWISNFDHHRIKPAAILKFVIAIKFKSDNDPGFKDMFLSKILKTVKKVSVSCDDVISLKTSCISA